MEGFFAQGGDSDAVEALQRQHELHHMSINDTRHSIHRLFHELDEDQTDALLAMLRTLSDPETSLVSVHYFFGILNQIKEQRFKKCTACGIDHEHEAAAMVEAIQLETEVGKVLKEMEEWGLKPDPTLSTADITADTPAYCVNCNAPYSRGLTDRKLRDKGPSGCEGCMQKAKWG